MEFHHLAAACLARVFCTGQRAAACRVVCLKVAFHNYEDFVKRFDNENQ